MNTKSKIIWLCSLFLLITTACMTRDEKIQANKAIGEEIIGALNKYEQTNGQFPETLDALVPNFLQEIPKTVDGSDFYYRLDNRPEPYYLIFKVRDGSGCNYLSKVDLWECTDGNITIEN